jgi:UDP-N-acetyl-D-galactosamine dehydrogenase
VETIVHDPLASAEEARDEYGIELRPFDALTDLDGLILAVAHDRYLDELDRVCAGIREGGLLVDVKSALDSAKLRADLRYWSL